MRQSGRKLAFIISLNMLWLVLFTLMVAGCGKKAEKVPEKTDRISFHEYYPINRNSVWNHQWHDVRGDMWRGSMAVLHSSKSSGAEVFIIADTTEKYGEVTFSRSAYMWDDQGLKHLYRITEKGDSTCFKPARLVLPSSLKRGETIESFYHYDVFAKGSSSKFSGDVKQTQKLVSVDIVRTPFGEWDNAALVETVRNDTYHDGSSIVRRFVAWYVKDIGPVKITTGIPQSAPDLEGDAIGLLVTGGR